MENQKIKASFESWYNGNQKQFSALYLGAEAAEFAAGHYESGTFATLHTFDSEEEGYFAFTKATNPNARHLSWEVGGGREGQTVIHNELRDEETNQFLCSWEQTLTAAE